MQKNYYDILQVAPTASFDAIKKAYRQLAKKFHPDADGNENTTHLFFDIQLAYETLSNPSLRQAYHYKYFVSAFDVDYTINTAYLVNALKQLQLLLQQLNKDSINYGLLQYQLQQIIDTKFFETIAEETNKQLLETYYKLGVETIKYLPYTMAIPFYTLLIESNTQTVYDGCNYILTAKKSHAYYYLWHTYKLVLVLLTAICFCLAMYWLV